MKIKLTYKPHEEQEAAADLALLQLRHPKGKPRLGRTTPELRELYIRVAPEDLREPTPCDLCRYDPPSSGDGKPCTMCPASS